jgi:hypothetical protein
MISAKLNILIVDTEYSERDYVLLVNGILIGSNTFAKAE